MSAVSDLKKRKLHVNLSLQADLYGLAQKHANAEGLSVSAFFERILRSFAQEEAGSEAARELDPDFAALRGVLKGPVAGRSKRDARAAKHEGRLRKARN
jgi:hypothetical protein